MSREFTKFCYENFSIEAWFAKGRGVAEHTAKWDGKDAVLQMPNGRVARIQLDTYGTQNRYERLTVTIVSKVAGKIDSKDFLFSEYLSKRKDDRPDHKGHFHAWQNNGKVDWYIAVPADLENLLEAVRRYIESMA